MAKTSKRANKKLIASKGGGSQNISSKIVSKTADASRPLTKHDQILTLLKRKDGATLEEMQKVSGWQVHSVRGFLSGQVRKLPGVKLQSSKSRDGVRRYAVIS